jgi:hypothetical protein
VTRPQKRLQNRSHEAFDVLAQREAEPEDLRRHRCRQRGLQGLVAAAAAAAAAVAATAGAIATTAVTAAAGTTATATAVAAAAGAVTATAVTATTTTEATGAWRTCLHRTGFVHSDATATQRLAIHASNSGLCFSIAAHFDKAETF